MSYRKQIQTVFFIELSILIVIASIAYLFWSSVCSGSGWSSCIGDGPGAAFWFVLFSVVRPFLFTPVLILALIAGDAYGPYWGTLLAALGATLSCMILYLPAKYLGRIYVKPFLTANLPAFWQFIRTQDYKVVFFTRWLPFFPFDFLSIIFGAADFRFKSVLLATFFGVLPECYMFANLADEGQSHHIARVLYSLTVFGLATIVPLVIYEILSRRRGSSLWNQMKNVYRELVFEVRANNEIVRHQEYDPEKIPVILLYGFFSSRRSLTVLERILQSRGFQVMSFNLGGLFGVFFTRGIRETARFVDVKIKRQIRRYDFKKVYLVGHSKGGLVAVYWLLKLGGYRYCKKVITMGTPFKGSVYTYLALISPLGYIWRDVWQMRPGSEFLRELHSLKIPDGVKIYCIYSERDYVTPGDVGVFEPKFNKNQVIPIPMNHIGHFEFLYRRDVGDVLAKILRAEDEDDVTLNVGDVKRKKRRRRFALKKILSKKKAIHE